jgi:tetratricopeptide (TPR) repeat protein
LAVATLIAGGFYYRSRFANQLTDKVTVVLADFANTTGDSVFEGTLKQALAIQLEQSPFLNVLPDRKINATLKLMNRTSSQRITQEVAREICIRTNSKTLLTGSIAGIGSQYLIGLKAVNCQTGDTQASGEATAENRDKVLKALGDVGNQLREKLGESLASVEKYNKPLAEATTSSPEALKAFTEGRRLQNEKSDADAVPYHRRALELDPNFARAYAALGVCYGNLNQAGLAAETLRKAYELRERVSERERFYIEATYYGFVTGEVEKANQSQSDTEAHYGRLAKARELSQRAVESAERNDQCPPPLHCERDCGALAGEPSPTGSRVRQRGPGSPGRSRCSGFDRRTGCGNFGGVSRPPPSSRSSSIIGESS